MVPADRRECSQEPSAKRKVSETSGGCRRPRPFEAEEDKEDLVGPLKVALTTLDAQYRVPITLCYENGLSRREAAEVLEMPERTLSRYVSTGLDRLRKTLKSSGYPVAVAVVLEGLRHTAPEVPASLVARIGTLVAGGAMNKGSPAAAPAAASTSTATNGRIGMKVIAGILAASALVGAGLVSSIGSGGMGDALPAVGGGGPGSVKMEHYAIAASLDYLDGPRLETLGSDKGRLSCNDEEGNVFFMWKYSAAWIRCITLDGQVKTIGGDDRWPTDLKLSEGPASYIPNMESGPGAGATCFPEFGITADGLPLQGEEKGSLYVYWGRKSPYRVYKSKEHGGRWWFKRLGTPGKAKPPEKKGESASVAEVDLTDARIGNGWIACNGNMYRFDSAKGTITCILTFAEYQPKVEAIFDNYRGKDKGKHISEPEHFMLANDGSIYLLYYLKNYPVGSVFKISADGDKVEFIVQHNKNVKTNNLDGLGRNTKWHCGPAWMRMSNETVLLRAIDSATVRRWQDGRVSTLCFDGQWREKSASTDRKSFHAVNSSGYQPADHGLPCIFIHYAGEQSGGDCRFFKFGPVDFSKPIVGSKAQPEGK